VASPSVSSAISASPSPAMKRLAFTAAFDKASCLSQHCSFKLTPRLHCSSVGQLGPSYLLSPLTSRRGARAQHGMQCYRWERSSRPTSERVAVTSRAGRGRANIPDRRALEYGTGRTEARFPATGEAKDRARPAQDLSRSKDHTHTGPRRRHRQMPWYHAN
jgi:hypothetical protein